MEGCKSISPYLSDKTLVTVVSTLGPGDTVNLLLPVLESSGRRAGRDFLLAHTPERISPSASSSVDSVVRVAGGIDTESRQAALRFLESLGFSAIPASSVEAAEATKMLENTYRLVNISLINELERGFSALGLDTSEVVRLASSKGFGFMPFHPSVGAGGHCIPVDPVYLERAMAKIGKHSSLLTASITANRDRPRELADRVSARFESVPPGDSRQALAILCLGLSYKAGVSDIRESRSCELVRELLVRGFHVGYHQPGLTEEITSLEPAVLEDDFKQALQNYDLTLVLHDFDEYVEEIRLLDSVGARWLAPSPLTEGRRL